MIDWNDSTGTFTIAFDSGPVTVRPPTFGGMKRLRRSRADFAEEARKRIAALPDLPVVEPPEPPDSADEEAAALHADALVAAAETRQAAIREQSQAVEDINLEESVNFWKLVLIGDETFRGLADPKPPADTDDWPPPLIYDIREIPRGTDGRFLRNADGSLDLTTMPLPLIDRVFQFWGKAR